MHAMFPTGPVTAGEAFFTQVLAATRIPCDTAQRCAQLCAPLCAVRDAAVSQAELAGQLSERIAAHPAHGDGLREARDRVTGGCSPHGHVHPGQEQTTAADAKGPA